MPLSRCFPSQYFYLYPCPQANGSIAHCIKVGDPDILWCGLSTFSGFHLIVIQYCLTLCPCIKVGPEESCLRTAGHWPCPSCVVCVNENQRTRRASGLAVSRENETDAHGAETIRTYLDTQTDIWTLSAGTTFRKRNFNVLYLLSIPWSR